MIIVSKEDKDFLTDDIFDAENNSQNTDVDSFEENLESNEEFTQNSEDLWGDFGATESNTSNEATEQNNGYSSQFGELEDIVDDSTDTENNAESQEQVKSASTKSVLVMAVVVILIVATIGLGAYFLFFNKSITSGVWVPVTVDETTKEIIEPEDDTIIQYYKFTDTDMIAYYSNGYAANESSGKIMYKDNTFSMADDANLVFKYEITSDGIKGKRLTLTIAGYEDQPMIFKWEPSAKVAKLTGPDFTVNDEILGFWKYEKEDFVTYKEFTKDGVTNEYTVYMGNCQIFSQKYNFDGENIVTLSPGGTDIYGATIEPGKEEKSPATLEGDKLTLHLSGIPYEFTKSSEKEYKEFKKAAMEGTYEYPTANQIEYEVAPAATDEATGATEVITVPATEEVTQ